MSRFPSSPDLINTLEHWYRKIVEVQSARLLLSGDFGSETEIENSTGSGVGKRGKVMVTGNDTVNQRVNGGEQNERHRKEK